MYLTGRGVAVWSWLASRRVPVAPPSQPRGPAPDPPACRPRRIVAGFHRLDAESVLERPQLLERFRALERRRLEPREREQELAAVDVEADVLIGGSRAAAVARRTGMGAREKYSAYPSRSTTTLTTFGLAKSCRIVDAAAQRGHHAAWRRVANGATASSIMAGSSSGSSPCTLTTRSQSRSSATSASRSVPLGSARCQHAPCRRTPRPRRIMRSSSVATMTRPTHAPRRRADTRARSSAGRRCRRAPCRAIASMVSGGDDDDALLRRGARSGQTRMGRRGKRRVRRKMRKTLTLSGNPKGARRIIA